MSWSAFDGADARFNGLAQRQGEALAVTAEGSRVSIKNQGEQQLALFLSNPRNGAMSLDLGFYIDGQLIHEAGLDSCGAAVSPAAHTNFLPAYRYLVQGL